jgi:hypothetical protein
MTFTSDRQRKKVMSEMNKLNRVIKKNYKLSGGLNTKQTIYVPSTDISQKEIPTKEINKRVKEVESFLSEKFGGYTEVKAHGGYILKDGKLVRENVVEVSAFCKTNDYTKNKNLIIEKLKTWGKEWGQETIGYEKDENFYMVEEK